MLLSLKLTANPTAGGMFNVCVFLGRKKCQMLKTQEKQMTLMYPIHSWLNGMRLQKGLSLPQATEGRFALVKKKRNNNFM